MPNIDDLSIGIKSNVTSATNSIDKLITKLGALSASLGQVNTSGFSAMASGIRQIENATKGISGNSAKNITELSLAIRKFGGKASTQATANIPQLGNALMQLSNSMASVGGMSFNTEGITNLASAINKLGGVKSSTAVQNIPQLTVALQGMVGSLNQIGTAGQSISALGQLSSSLSKLGGKTVTNAITNIPQLTNALMQMMSTLSKAPQVSYNVIQLVNSMANLASQGSKVGTASNSLYNGFMRFGKGAEYARKKSFSLASAIGKLYASYFLLFRLFGSIGKAIDISSSLTEVENVVNVTFGKYRNLLDDFAETSLQQYGIGELDAKKFASRYQSMGVAMGFTQEQMAEMSVELTKLTGDYASFYDAALGDVHEDMLAIFTGQTRPLRSYGLDLTQATLQEWALSEGMQVNIQDMTQMEKTMLRYQYVMANSEHVIGDFLRTADSWHNMMTVLNGTLKEFAGTVGNVAINFLKPLVAWFNNAIVVVNEFAVSIMNALGKLFGWEYKYTPGGLTQEDVDIVDDYGSALGGASDKAKKLKQQLQGFDELNVLTTNTPSSGGAGGGGSLDDYEFTQTGGLFNIEEVKEIYESEIDSLYELGEYISTTISSGLRDIDWQEVYQGAKDFGFGLADFLNGLISPDLFGATGRTIAGALNTAIYSSLAFGTEFDFDEFGSSIAQGINEFFDEFDFAAFGQNIATWVKGLKDSLLVAIAEIEWGDVLAGIGDLLGSLDAETIATLFAFGALSTLFKNGLFGALSTGLTGITTLPTSLSSGITTVAGLIVTSFKSAVIGALAGWNIAKYLIFEYDEEISDGLEAMGFDVYENLDEYYAAQSEKQAKIDYYATYYAEQQGIEVSDDPLTRGLQAFAGRSDKANKWFNSTTKNVINLNKYLNAFGVDTKKLGNITAESFKQIANGNGIFETMSTALPEYADVISNGVSNRFKQMSDNVTTAITWFAEGALGTKYNNALTNFASKSVNGTQAVDNAYKLMANGITGSMLRVEDNTISSSERTKNGVLSELANMRNGSNSTLDALNRDTTNKFATIKNNAISQLVGLSIGATNQFASVNTGATRGLAGLGTTVSNAMSKAKAAITNESWYTPGVNLVGGLQQGITNQWNVGLTTKVLGLANNLTSTLKKGFGIHSPSRIWRDEIGSYLTQGLEVGILGEESHLQTSIASMGARLTNTMSGALTLATPSSLSSGYNFGVTSTMAHNFTADGSMSSNIAQGVRDGVYSAQAEQNALLREQNSLLLQILNKEGISMDDVYTGVVTRNRDNINRTGLNPLMAY